MPARQSIQQQGSRVDHGSNAYWPMPESVLPALTACQPYAHAEPDRTGVANSQLWRKGAKITGTRHTINARGAAISIKNDSTSYIRTQNTDLIAPRRRMEVTKIRHHHDSRTCTIGLSTNCCVSCTMPNRQPKDRATVLLLLLLVFSSKVES